VSYRYPFVDARTGGTVAPVDMKTDDWDAYQGNEMGVMSLIPSSHWTDAVVEAHFVAAGGAVRARRNDRNSRMSVHAPD
jgi:hypothetical protein